MENKVGKPIKVAQLECRVGDKIKFDFISQPFCRMPVKRRIIFNTIRCKVHFGCNQIEDERGLRFVRDEWSVNSSRPIVTKQRIYL